MVKELENVDQNTPLASATGLLILLQMKGVGPVSALSLSAKFKSLEDLSQANRSLTDSMCDDAISKANLILNNCRKNQINLISHYDSEFPCYLKEIPQPAPLLYVKGKLFPSNKYIACVGTREPTQVGVKTAKFTTSYFSKKGWSIVSGLALGIDALCHEEALISGGHTVAVLANGLDSVSPKSHTKLAERILECGGALVSEYPPEFPVYPRNLVIRDRLQSGFSVGTIPMQTGIKGGTLHTINFSFLQKRFVVVPVHTNPDVKSEGLTYLLRLLSSSKSFNEKNDPIFPNFNKDYVIPLKSESMDEIELMLSDSHRNFLNKGKSAAGQMRLL